MAQKTNLNVIPYFDDFSEPDIGAKDKNYYKVLFNPGKAIQARELNTLQSILQNQVETFGSHIFKEGSLVIPGNIVFDNQFSAVKLNPQQFGVEIISYLKEFEGKTIIGQTSGVTASVQLVQLPNSEVEYPTIYVKYIGSDSNFEINPFQDNEILYSNETVGAITSGTPFATTINSNSTATGSAASIGEGVYFVRGTFVRVPKQTIILDYYENVPSYRVGLRVNEKIITAKDDSTLYDNVKGFTNYSAPGADRFQISLTLSKKSLDDLNDTDFIEILRLRNGAIKKVETQSQYSIIKDYLAQRTYDESGNYVVDQFQISLNNSLNDRLGNDGLFFENEKTDQKNTPSNDLMCIKLSPGKAYVRGYDIQKSGISILDVPKPRTKQTVSSVNIPFEMGNLLRVNNISGAPKQKEVIYLQSHRKNSTIVSAGTTIGFARVYSFNVTDSAYSGATTNWDLYLYDVQTYTELQLNQSVTSVEIPATSFIKGKSSGASGYAVSSGSGSDTIILSQTSGSFSTGEAILINGSEIYPRVISSIKVYKTEDIKSVHQPIGFTTAFLADTQLDRISRSGLITISANSGGISTATISAPATFSGIRSDTIIRYQRTGLSTEVYNRVISVSSSLNSLTLAGVSTVNGICDGSLPASQFNGSYSLGISDIKNTENGFLYAELPNQNVSSVNLNSSTITFSAQSNITPTPSGNTLTVNTGNFNLGINSTTAKFEAFDEERYSIFYSDGTIENLTSDKVSISPNSDEVTFSNIQNKLISTINATFVKNGIQSKIKQFNRSNIINITFSKNSQSGVGVNTSINDGLTYNKFYGLRVQDEEISLNYPDVSSIIAVYESLDTSSPILDQISFNSVANVSNNAIIGENIVGSTSNSIARVVTKPSTDTLGIVYLNANKFISGENVSFEESNINTTIDQIVVGKYQNITNKFILDKGQKDQYYDYSKIIRKSGESSPSKQLLVVFDYYSVAADDSGDVFTSNSYSEERFLSDIPTVGNFNIRLTDTLDFRPRVSVFTDTTKSPFDFSSRSFGSEPKILMSPNESALVGYDFYLGRIDKIYLDKLGVFSVITGNPSINPKEPSIPSDVMELATITLPPYLYNPKDAQISLVDNRRYTMRDIGRIEDRVENLERVTSLSLLELNTQTLQIQDAQGINRFKSGFFVDDFKNTNLINLDLSAIEVDEINQELRPFISKNSLDLKLVSAENITDENFDSNENFVLFDSNVKKSGDVVTLNYDSVDWINQPFATQVENVNPFHVISYVGNIKLNPSSDSWVRTIRLSDIEIVKTTRVANASRRGRTVVTGIDVFDTLISRGREQYMRSRNVEFKVFGLKENTRYYQFLDGNSGVDFIPKLIEISPDSSLQNYGASSSFVPGETVIGTFNNENIISFRVSNSNHKEGPFNNPSVTYTQNPYLTSESIPSNYSASSKTLNVDTTSLSLEVQGLYSGYITIGTKLVGQTSGAVAYVKDLRLISDKNGFICGSFFLRNPLLTPPPAVRIETGTKIYKLNSSSTNENPIPGSKLASSAETIYKSEGTWEQRQRIITTRQTYYYDPLAQSFIVGGVADTENGNKPNEDVNGAYLTAVDLYFASKDSGNAPLTVEIRTVEFGTPTTTILGNPVTLQPDNISVSSDASVATKVTFDYPIYLAPGLSYAIVLLAPQSIQYEVWIAEMGTKTIETKNLPDSESVRYTRQFAIGRLYKSQNGGEWTANDYQDMKFKLYKANFTSSSGSVLFHNPTLNESNGYVPTLDFNPITILPKQVKVAITTTTNSTNIGILTTGRKITSNSESYKYGYIVGTGSSVSSVGITTGGFNYTSTNNVGTYAITGSGSGLKLNITATNGVITGVSVSSAYPGNGYQNGDVVGIVTADVSPASGNSAQITITGIGTGIDTLYLSNVQANEFNAGQLNYFDTSGTIQTISGVNLLTSTNVGGLYAGNFLKINHFEHGLYSNNNKVVLSNIQSNTVPTTLTDSLGLTDTIVSVASTSVFSTFEGVAIDPSTNPGFIKIGNEIMKYTAIGSGSLTVVRGINSTKIENHNIGDLIYKYELGGVSLLRINKEHDISDQGIEIDSYYVEFDRGSDTNIVNRSSDSSPYPTLSFATESSCGGTEVRSTENIQFNSIIPHVNPLNPSPLTSTTAQIRTISGTSVSGNEVSFIDQGYEDVGLDIENNLSSTRIIASNVNEITYLNSLLRNKSFTLKIDLSTNDSNLSPVIFWKEVSAEFLSSRINRPILDYIGDNRVNNILDDPHAAIYVSNTVQLTNPATSLKVLVSAYRDSSADFRVLYSLIRPDSSEIEQSFNLFPGYNNLSIDNNGDTYLDVIDASKNSGLPDVFVPASLENQFLEYEFTASDLGIFTGYTIKIVMSGTDQSKAPRFKDLRTIAIR
jgi:hypothetical protein